MKFKLLKVSLLVFTIFKINAEFIDVTSFISGEKAVYEACLQSLNKEHSTAENNSRKQMYVEALNRLNRLQANLSSETDSQIVQKEISEYKKWYNTSRNDIDDKFASLSEKIENLSSKILVGCIKGYCYAYKHPCRVIGGTVLASAILYGAYKWYQSRSSSKEATEEKDK